MVTMMMALIGIIAARYANCSCAQHHIRCVAAAAAAARNGTRIVVIVVVVVGVGVTVAVAVVTIATDIAARLYAQRGRGQRIQFVFQWIAAAV